MRLGFDRSCSAETGRLLRTLAASRPGGKLLELGSGLAVGASWLLAGMNAAARLLTVENDPLRAETVWELLSADARAEVLHGDWTAALERGPFDLIFADCKPSKVTVERLIDTLNPGGVLVLDNLSPPELLPEALHAGDPLRDAVFSNSRLCCTELQVSHRECVIVATRTA